MVVTLATAPERLIHGRRPASFSGYSSGMVTPSCARGVDVLRVVGRVDPVARVLKLELVEHAAPRAAQFPAHHLARHRRVGDRHVGTAVLVKSPPGSTVSLRSWVIAADELPAAGEIDVGADDFLPGVVHARVGVDELRPGQVRRGPQREQLDGVGIAIGRRDIVRIRGVGEPRRVDGEERRRRGGRE